MVRLDHRSRTLILCASALSFASAFVATPQTARSADEPTIEQRSLIPIRRVETPIAVIEPQRDPFVGERTLSDAPPVAEKAAPPASSAPLIPLQALPPNAGAGGQLLGAGGSMFAVRAIVNGERPVALLIEGGTTRVVGIGDRVEATRITHILPERIILADGRHLSLESTARRVVPLTRDANAVPLVPIGAVPLAVIPNVQR